MRFRLRLLLGSVAALACALGAATSFAREPETLASVLTGWAALYAVPSALILGRPVPLRKVLRVWCKFSLWGLLVAGLCGFPGLIVSGFVSLAGIPLAVMLVFGLAALLAAAFSTDEPRGSQADPDPLPCMSPVDWPGV